MSDNSPDLAKVDTTGESSYPSIVDTDRASNTQRRKMIGYVLDNSGVQLILMLLILKGVNLLGKVFPKEVLDTVPAAVYWGVMIVMIVGLPAAVYFGMIYPHLKGRRLLRTKTSPVGRVILNEAEGRLRAVRATGDKDVEKTYRHTMRTIENLLNEEALITEKQAKVFGGAKLSAKDRPLRAQQAGGSVEVQFDELEIKRTDLVQRARAHLEILLELGKAESAASREIGRLTEARGRVRDLEERIQTNLEKTTERRLA